MALPPKERPLNYRIPGDLYHAVFEAVGSASTCWKPMPDAQLFDSERASKVAVDLCFKIADELEKWGYKTREEAVPNIPAALETALSDDETVLLADGFEGAFLGIARQFHKPFAVYSRDRCIKILVERDGMTEDEAEEFFAFNVEDAYVGENTPAFLAGLP